MRIKVGKDGRVEISPYIEGYLGSLFERGEQPTYGYPCNHLPETNDVDIEFFVGFLSEPRRPQG